MPGFVCLYLLALPVAAAPPDRLSGKIESLLAASAGAKRAFWGIHIVRLAGGRAVYQSNADSFFIPASNTKLFSTALALDRLGPGHRFHTVVQADALPDAGGLLEGDLVLYGGGDPSLSDRIIPYAPEPWIRGPVVRGIENLADQIVAGGVRDIRGGIVGDDSAYVWEPYPEGWAEEDIVWEYGAPVSALTINENAVALTVRPAEAPGLPAECSLRPAIEYYSLDNRLLTIARGERKLLVDRPFRSRQVHLSGTMPLKGPAAMFLLAIDDPALYAAQALREALTRRGVNVRGRVSARHRHAGEPPWATPAGVELARLSSPPLVQLLQVTNKVSQNLYAELMLREVSRVKRFNGGREAGLAELDVFLSEAGIPPQDYHFEDASGLSRKTLVTPAAVTRLLLHMYRSKGREPWMGLLPVGGFDGTLRSRFSKDPAAGRVQAKTGSVAHVASLAGYANKRYAFSILVNNFNVPAAEIRKVIDRIVLLLAD
jgi:D-alanyl-D-alanine carboxypeptidase/D-alanyl-D-alanine-endopeptidase (penicillin-binding protein 4)